MSTTDKKRLTVYVDDVVREKVEQEAKNLGITISGYINVLIADRFRQEAAMNVFELAKKITEMQSEKEDSLLT